MIIIGEKINTTLKAAHAAVADRDEHAIRELARRQADAGANYIDINCGTFSEEEPELLPWLVQVVQDELGGKPVCIDSNNPQAIANALAVHRGKALLNVSYSGEKERYEALDPIIKRYESAVVCLCIDDDNGIPPTAELRFQIADMLVGRLNSLGVSDTDIYIDPLVQPISVDTDNGLKPANTIRLIREKHPDVHAVCGLSNISFELPERKLVNQAFMVMLASYGLDSVILNPEDRAMMRMVYAIEMLLGHDKYCKKFTKAYKKGLLALE